MRLKPNAVASLLLPLFIALLPATLTGCGGDRYSCDNCEGSDSPNPDDSNAEDPSEFLAETSLNLVEAAQFTALDLTNPDTIEDFANYTKIDLQFGTYANASLDKYDKDNPEGNLMPISGELWDDNINVLDFAATTSILGNNKLRAYYQMTSAASSSEWTLIGDNNVHDLRIFEDRIYEVWLGWTIKWEVFKAHDKGYPEIAGKEITFLTDPAFNPPIIADSNTLQSALLWGKDWDFTDGAEGSKAEMFVIYKQFRPVDVEGKDLTVSWVALVPAVANSEGDLFAFTPVSTDNSLENFTTAHQGAAYDARVQVNEKLFISFNISGAGVGAAGANLWDSRTSDFPVAVDYIEAVSTNGSYIRIDIPMADKVTYGLETYENPIFAQIEDGVNDGIHLGWLYQRSNELTVDLPQPHYAFNDIALTDIKAAFKNWRRNSYCEDSDHRDDPNRETICATVITP